MSPCDFSHYDTEPSVTVWHCLKANLLRLGCLGIHNKQLMLALTCGLCFGAGYGTTATRNGIEPLATTQANSLLLVSIAYRKEWRANMGDARIEAFHDRKICSGRVA